MAVKLYKHNRKRTQAFYLAGCTFSIPLSIVNIDPGKPFLIQYVVTNNPHADCYAQRSSSSDDGARVVIRIRGTTIDGSEFNGIARSWAEAGVLVFISRRNDS